MKEELVSHFESKSFVNKVYSMESNPFFNIKLETAKPLDKENMDKVRKEGYQVRHIGTQLEGSKFNQHRVLRIWFEPRD